MGKIQDHAGVNCPRSVDGGLPVHHIPVITGIVSPVTVCVKILSKISEFFSVIPRGWGKRNGSLRPAWVT